MCVYVENGGVGGWMVDMMMMVVVVEQQHCCTPKLRT